MATGEIQLYPDSEFNFWFHILVSTIIRVLNKPSVEPDDNNPLPPLEDTLAEQSALLIAPTQPTSPAPDPHQIILGYRPSAPAYCCGSYASPVLAESLAANNRGKKGNAKGGRDMAATDPALTTPSQDTTQLQGGAPGHGNNALESPIASLLPSSSSRYLTPQSTDTFVALENSENSKLSATAKGKRKQEEVELAPHDSARFQEMGLTPFVKGREPLFNQNRIVHNEVIASEYAVDTRHELDILKDKHYTGQNEILGLVADINARLDNLEPNPIFPNLHQIPEFKFLFTNAHATRDAHNTHVKKMDIKTATLERSINDLFTETHDLKMQLASLNASSLNNSSAWPTALVSSFHTPHIAHQANRSFTPSTPTTSFIHNVPSTSSTIPTKRPNTQGPPPIRSRLSPHWSTSRNDIIVGPLEIPDGQTRETANTILDKVGMATESVESVKVVPGFANYLSLHFARDTVALRFSHLLKKQPDAPYPYSRTEWNTIVRNPEVDVNGNGSNSNT